MEAPKILLERTRLSLLRKTRAQKRAILVVLDSFALLMGYVLAHLLVVGRLPAASDAALAGMAILLVGLPLTALMGFYKSVIRFVGADMSTAAARVSAVHTIVLAGALAALAEGSQWARLSTVFLFVAFSWMASSRFFARLIMNKRVRNRESVVIYGAGRAGIRLAASLGGGSRFHPVGFIDDNPTLLKSRINGLEVFSPRDIARVIETTGATRVLIAVPSASRRSRKAIIDRLEPLAVRVQTIPDMDDVITGVSRLEDLRDVAVEDLLGRDPVPPHNDLLCQENAKRSVMVTGAGGSIGSELCRQLLEVEPTRIVLVERSEIALYSLDRELRRLAKERGLEVQLTALLADVRDRRRMREIIDVFSVDTIYHAAAYKHVPIVEHNMFEGILNNVSGTAAVADAAMQAEVGTFVLVSTDKAVSPTNVMGASKRLAELVLQAQALQSTKTRFCMVRFGNVLASSGSVVPLFREQIRSGGPVTVTHPEIIRYFMTIPEAAQLVIQAGAMASGGDVFVLDMGEPVKIVDLATKMIHLMGQSVKTDEHPGGDIEIVYTGLRPAEKLYEELLIGNNVTGTKHPRIMRANEACLEPDMMQGLILTIERLAERRDYDGMRDLMVQYVEGYLPTGQVADHLYPQRVRKVSSTVTSLNDYQQANESKRVPD